MKIPLVDLAWQHAQIAAEVETGLAGVFERSDYVLGAAVGEFERAFADFCEVPHCIGVGSGTDALELGLRAIGVGPGDEVVVPAHTFVASALAVLRAGATPVLADVDDEALLLDPAAVEAVVTGRTRAVMPVHLYGQMAPMAALDALAGEHGFALIEDAAQSQGARQSGRRAGSVGRVAGTSFYPGKNIGAYGDAGAVLTADDEVAASLRRLRNWGSDQKYFHPEPGFNSRLDTLQAVVLKAKLARLEAWNALRVDAAARYDALLDALPATHDVEAPRRVATLPGNESVYHLYVIRLRSEAERDATLASLAEAGVGAGIHYPTPLHLHGALASLGHAAGAFPVAEVACQQMLSLPLHPGTEAAQQERVVEVLASALRTLR